VSPYTLLKWRRGDAFDMSLLLCSLLLGAGAWFPACAVGHMTDVEQAMTRTVSRVLRRRV
jgi:hypothetical protein